MKKIFSLFLILGLWAGSAGATDYTADAQCEAAFLMNSNQTILTDESGRAGNFTKSGSPTYTDSGKYGGGFSFNGTSDYFSNSGTLTTITKSTASMAIVGYVNLDSTSEKGAFMNLGNSAAADGFAIGVGSTTMDNAGNNIIGLYNGVRWIETGDAIGTGWHHFSLVINASGHPEIFIDGNSVYSDSTGAPGSAGAESAGQVGSQINGNRPVDATLDEIGYFLRTLSSTEIGDIKDHGLKGDQGATPPTGRIINNAVIRNAQFN